MYYDNPARPLRAVCVLDPAIDRVASEITRYRETRDPALIVELPGQMARWVTLRPLTSGQMAHIDSRPGAAFQLQTAFVASCVSIENLTGPGTRWEPTNRVPAPGGGEMLTFTPGELEFVFAWCGAAFIHELGAVAYERAQAGNLWGGSVYYTLPQSSVLGLTQIERHLAERATAQRGTSYNGASSGDSASANAPSSDAVTVAPATAGTVGQGESPNSTPAGTTASAPSG